MKKKTIYLTVLAICLVIGIVSFILINNLDEHKNIFVEENNPSETENLGNSYATYSYITEEIKNSSEKQEIYAELNSPYTPEYMLENADAVALVSVISLDGASAEYNPMFGMTYGKLLVNQTIKGNINNGDILEYLKSGGTLTVADWEQYQDPEANEKREYLRQLNGVAIDKENTYMSLKLLEDIDIEAGKTYFVYLKFCDAFQKYEIIGLGNGLREVNIEQQTNRVYSRSLNIDTLQIKNNQTGNYESLSEYIDKYINI